MRARIAAPAPGRAAPLGRRHADASRARADPAALPRASRDAFPLRAGAEVSIEVDPRVTTTRTGRGAARAAASTASRSACRTSSRACRRRSTAIQPASMTARSSSDARRARLREREPRPDLRPAVPDARRASSARSTTVLAIGPDRIALYSYAHVTWVAKQQRGFERKDLPDAGDEAADPAARDPAPARRGLRLHRHGPLRAARRRARAARSAIGTLRRNFMGYTTQAGVDLLGFGPSAISELPASYAQTERELGAWEQAVRGARRRDAARPPARRRRPRAPLRDRADHVPRRGRAPPSGARASAASFAERFARELASARAARGRRARAARAATAACA